VTIARQHHFLPECYLKGFTRGGGNLFALDIKKRNWYSPSPGQVCKQRDFNRVEVPGLKPDELERQLGKFEGKLAPALRRVCSEPRNVRDDDWTYVLNLISLIAARNPVFRENFRAFKTQVMKVIAQMHVSSPEVYQRSIDAAIRDGFVDPELAKKLSYEDAKKFVTEENYTIEFPHGSDAPAEFHGQDTVLQQLGMRKWMFISAPADSPGFVTCDYPVCLSFEDPSIRRRAVGHAMPGTNLVFPVCRRLVVIGSFEGEGGRKVGDESFVERINAHIASFAVRHVLGSGNDVRFAVDGGVKVGAEMLDAIQPVDEVTSDHDSGL
jgi:hypothetical protein